MKSIFGPHTGRVAAFLTDLQSLSAEEVSRVAIAWKQASNTDRVNAGPVGVPPSGGSQAVRPAEAKRRSPAAAGTPAVNQQVGESVIEFRRSKQ